MSGPDRDFTGRLLAPLRDARIRVDVRERVRQRVATLGAPAPADPALPLVFGVAAQALALCAVAWMLLVAGGGGAASSLSRPAAVIAGQLGLITDELLRATGALLLAAGRALAAVIAAIPVPSGAVNLDLVTFAACCVLAAALAAGAAALARDLSRPSPPWRTHA